jgi:hypothetical protein
LHCIGGALLSASFHILHSSRESPLSPCPHWTSRLPKSLSLSTSLQPSSSAFRASTIPSPPVQDPLAATRSTDVPSPRLPHNPHAFHSLSRRPCGSIGKSRSHLPLRAPVFLMSSSPQPRFRKPTPPSNPRPHAISPLFPLFLPHLRVLLFFIYLYPYLSTPSRRHAAHIPSLAVAPSFSPPLGERVRSHSPPQPRSP